MAADHERPLVSSASWPLQGGDFGIAWVQRNVVEEGVSFHSALVPLVHGVDGFRKLSARRLVDAARVDPDPVEAIAEGLLAAPLNLGKALLLASLPQV